MAGAYKRQHRTQTDTINHTIDLSMLEKQLNNSLLDTKTIYRSYPVTREKASNHIARIRNKCRAFNLLRQ